MVTEETTRILPDIAIPPGELLQETLDALNMTQVELAARMGRPTTVVNEIIKGKKAITPETAIQLEHVLRTPAYIWNGLERDYQLIRAKLDEDARLERQVSQLEKYSFYPVMVREGWVQRQASPVGKVRELLRFFGVASLDEVRELYAPAFRKARGKEASPEALAAWMRRGEILAREVETREFNPSALKECLQEFRGLTREPPQTFEPIVRERCAERGVAWVVVPHLPKTYVNGATWWDGERFVVEMSLRFKWNDIFWFTFFHELGHVLLHRKSDVFIDTDSAHGDESKEAEANDFATRMLIDSGAYRAFVSRGRFTWSSVQDFADDMGVHPGIVVGRLQHDRHIRPDQLNGLRAKFELRTAPAA